MDVMHALWQGWLLAATPANVLWALAGCLVGTALGVMPGFGPSVAIALLLPMTFHVDITSALIFFIAVACAGMYGGSKASILLNIPGETASVVTALEGHRMALRGRAGAALATAAVGSCVGGTLAALLVVGVAPWVAGIAQHFGPAARFMLMVMALGAVSVGIGKSTLRGMTALWLGIALACVGFESISGVERWAGGLPFFTDGVEILLVAVGVFVVAEVLHAAMFEGAQPTRWQAVGPVRLLRSDYRRSWRAWLRGTVLGTPLGCVPVGGVEMSTYVSYAAERYVASDAHRAQFGREGAIEGVAGPEAANNATVTAALIPLLTMGIPTSNTTAMMVGAFRNYGVEPGAQWFAAGHTLVWALLASLFIGNAILLVLHWPLARVWTWLLRIPRPHRYATMLVLVTASTYGMRQSVGDLALVYGFGLLGLAMRRLDFPLTPMVIGLALAPMAEQQLRQALAIGNGSWLAFVQQPLALGLLLLALVLVLLPPVLQGWLRRNIARARAMASDEGYELPVRKQ